VQALFAIADRGDQPIREQLSVLQLGRLVSCRDRLQFRALEFSRTVPYLLSCHVVDWFDGSPFLDISLGAALRHRAGDEVSAGDL